MLDHNLKKYRDFKGYLDEYFRGDLDKDDILHFLEEVRIRYEKQHAALLAPLDKDQAFYSENQEWIEVLRDAVEHFEEARDAIEDAILEGRDDIEEALEIFREGNRILLEVNMDLEEMVERTTYRDTL